MDKLDLLKSLNPNRIKSFIAEHDEHLKTAILPLIIGIAVLFFWIYGSDDGEVSVERPIDDGAATVENMYDGDDSDSSLGIGSGSNQIEDGELHHNNGSDGQSASKKATIYVDISGEVNTPGVYIVAEGTRIFEVIEMAGGLTQKADINVINRAEPVYDGQKIIIPKLNERTAASDEESGIGDSSGIKGGKVNLNYADSATLQTIPGIGPSKAERIIEYRKTEGMFKSIEDIKNITGIGDKTFESLKDYITV